MKIGKVRGFVALSLILGLAFWAGAVEAQDKPILRSIEVVSPDSGVVRGIDSTFTVVAKVQEINAPETMKLYLWLISGGDDEDASKVLLDDINVAGVDSVIVNHLDNLTETSDFSDAIEVAGHSVVGASISRDGDVENSPNPSGGDDVDKPGAFDDQSASFDSLSTSEFAVVIEQDADGEDREVGIYTFTWTGKVPASTAEHDDVRVAGFVASTLRSKVVVSDVANSFRVDGDRPSQLDVKLLDNPSLNEASLPTTNPSISESGEERFARGFDFDTGKFVQLAGIGDTLVVVADLDSAGTAEGDVRQRVLIQNELRLRANVQGVWTEVRERSAFPSGENTQGIVVHEIIISEDMGFGNLDQADADSAITVAIYTVDAAGNLSSPYYAGREVPEVVLEPNKEHAGFPSDLINADEVDDDFDRGYLGTDADDPSKYLFQSNTEGQEGDYTLTSFDDDPVALGVQKLGVTFRVDDKRPALLGEAAGDTLLPASNDTISDGSISDVVSDDGFNLDADRKDDLISWNLDEVLSILEINIVGAFTATIDIEHDTDDLNDTSDALTASADRYVDFSELAADGAGGLVYITGPTNDSSDDEERALIGGRSDFPVTFSDDAADDAKLTDGIYTLQFQPTDMAGNSGPVTERTNVLIDPTPLAFNRLFPTDDRLGDVSGAEPDTINAEVAAVIFQMSEVADSVLIQYKPHNGSLSTIDFPLAGSLLQDTGKVKHADFVDSLVHGNTYDLRVIGRDLAGNFTLEGPFDLHYDTTFVVPQIAFFEISVDIDPGLEADKHLLAGTEVNVTVQAKSDQQIDDVNLDAVIYAQDVQFRVSGGNGVAISSDLTTSDEGGDVWTLKEEDWLVGEFTLTLKDTAAIDTLTLSVLDTTDLWAGALDSAIVYDPEIYSKINVSAPDTVNYGEEFWVSVQLADKFNNTRVLDTRWVEAQSDLLGTYLPENAIAIENGWGGFYAAVHGEGWVTLDVRDIVQRHNFDGDGSEAYDDDYPDSDADVGGDFFWGRSTSYINSDVAIDAPDTLIASDYRGADDNGDQGGFVKLVFDLSDDHGAIDGYRIWRQIASEHGVDDNGDIVALDEPGTSIVPWAFVDAVPGLPSPMLTVIVATLDNVATHWAVSAEAGGFSSVKQAFEVGEVVENPYELMSETMIQSRKLADQVDPDAPVFATLTPEALAFVEQGIVPRFKGVGGTQQSLRVHSAEAVRGIDNIAPVGVEFMRATDTPGDAGGSITVTWTKSESDALVPRTVGNAVGPNVSDLVPGVLGYQILRSAGDEEFTLVGKAGSGETSFVDETVFNGERYTYSVRPYDQDNVTESDLSRTSMAIRNSVFDANGVAVLGLFGPDNQVGFDDFFVFADYFGLTAADEGFEPAFDLRPNNRVDFDDFFVFADNFGRRVEAAGKLLPTRSGLNSDARLFLSTLGNLSSAGEETQILVNLADFAELKGYGFTLQYDANDLEFVKVMPVDDNLLGETALAQPRIITQKDGEISVAAYGETAVDGELAVNLVFRFKEGTEESFVELTQAQLRDDGFAVNQVASLDRFRIETRPESFALLDNFPNPFNPETTIKYQLPEAADVKLEIRNVVGQLVRTLVAEHQNAGRYTVQWDASNDNGQQLSSGVYFYLVEAGEFRQVKRMLLLK